MNKQEIDELFSIIENNENDDEILQSMFNITIEEIANLSGDKVVELARKFVKKIEEENFEYFVSKLKDQNSVVQEYFIEFLNYLSNEKKQELIKIITKDESGKDNIDSKVISKEYKESMEDGNLLQLIQAIGDIEFTKDNIRNLENRGLDIQKDSQSIATGKKSRALTNVLKEHKANNEEINDFIKECIRKNYGLLSYNIRELLELLNEQDFTKECIRKNYGLLSYNIRELLELLNEQDFTKECIRKNYGLESADIRELLKLLNEQDFTRECICDTQNIEINMYDIQRLIFFLIKKEEKDMQIFSHERLEKSIEDLGDEQITKACLIKIGAKGLSTEYIESKLDYLKDKELIRTCILNNREYGLRSEYIAEKLEELQDEELIRTCILNGSNSGLRSEYIAGKLEDLQDEELKACILNGRNFGFISEYIIKKVKEINDKEFGKEILKNCQDIGLSTEVICELIKFADAEMAKRIKFEEIEELLSMEDASYIKDHLLNNIILKNMENQNVDINRVNEEIEKIYEIFLTNDLPNNFKYFEFFKNHTINHDNNNYEFYSDKDINKRDQIISGDLFRILLESDNIKMRSFLENLYNGNLAINGKNDDEFDKAILLKYRDILYELLDVVEPNLIAKTENYNEDLSNIKTYLKAKENDDLGEIILLKYFEKVGLDYKKEDKPLIETLINYMDTKKKEAQENNNQEFNLEIGDVIKGTDIQYLEDFLQNGIRSKEFYMVGSISSDATPLDTDFSEITESNLQKTNLIKMIDSTVSSGYGKTYLVIKKDNYENDEKSYSQGSEGSKTRYFRTGLGSTNISAIITAEWNDEYKYALAKNGFYIPVINKEDGKVLFTYEEYEQIRESMQGLSHYGIDDFALDETANNMLIKQQAEELKENTKGKISTEEKREKIIEFVRKNIGKDLTSEMIGDISSRFLEFIDTGSTRKRNKLARRR